MSKINEYLERNNTNFPNDIGVIFNQDDNYTGVTNNEIYQYVNSLVDYLKDKYTNIAIIGSNSLEWAISLWAIFGYVGNAILIDKELNKKSIEHIFSKVNPDLIIIDDNIDLKLDTYTYLRFSEINKIMKKSVTNVLNNDHSGSIYLHTSGTTGMQKIVQLNEVNIFGVIPELNNKWQVTHKDSCLLIIPMYHIYALTSMFHSMYAGTTIIIESDYEKLEKVLKETKPTLFMGVPLMYNRIKDAILSKNKNTIQLMINISNLLLKANIDMRNKIFKKIHQYFGGRYFFGCSAGSILSYDTNKFFNDIGLPIYNVYGMTETSGPVAINYKNNNKYNSVGKILDINQVKIVNKGLDNIGEIWVKGTNIFNGYIGGQDSSDIKDGYFDTGDIGYIENNFLYVKGRKKNILIGDNGKNISPEELNRKILKYADINDCNIIMENNHLIAVINTQLDELHIKRILDKINKKLPNYKKISEFRITNKNIK